MKSFFIILFCLFISFIGFSQTYQTVQSGDWNDPCTWSTTCDPASVPPTDASQNNFTIKINDGHEVRLDGDFLFNNKLTLIIYGSLIVGKDMGEVADLEGNGLILRIHCGASLKVNGALRLKNIGDLMINGTFIVDGIYGHQVNSGNCIYTTEPVCNGTIVTNDGGEPPVVGFNYGGVGKCDEGTPPILPIELLDFSLIGKEDHILINWTTGSEINNDYFTIERSRDLYGWEVLGFVEGAGNSSTPLSYSFSDLRPLDGLAYYRLKQTDFDGAFKYYGPIAAHYDLGMEGLEFKVMKNFSYWVIAVPNDGIYQVEVYNLQGHRLHSERVENTLSIPAPEGAVVIRVTDGFERSASRVVM